MTIHSLKSRRLGREFYAQPTEQVARNLLGKLLVRKTVDGQRLSGIVIEVEAYLSQGDFASHSYRGLGKKNASMFLSPGTLYVYPIHSRHCLNVVTESKTRGAAVLIRAIEPWEGVQRMAENRGLFPQPDGSPPILDAKMATRLGTGPGRLCEALAIDRSLDGLDLRRSDVVWLEECPGIAVQSWEMMCGKRIGISKSEELPLRWFVDGHRFVSGSAREHSRGRSWCFDAARYQENP